MTKPIMNFFPEGKAILGSTGTSRYIGTRQLEDGTLQDVITSNVVSGCASKGFIETQNTVYKVMPTTKYKAEPMTTDKLLKIRSEAIEKFTRLQEEDPHAPVAHFDLLLTEAIGEVLDVVVDDYSIGDVVYEDPQVDPNCGPGFQRIDLKGQFFAAVNT